MTFPGLHRLLDSRVGGWWLGFGILVALILLLPFVLSRAQMGMAIIIGIFSLAAVGLDLTFGYAGMLSLGHGAFFGIGAYATAILTTRYQLDSLSALGVGVAVSVLTSLILGMLCSRLEMFDVALATMGLAIITESFLLGFRSFTGGGAGITGIPPFQIFGFAFLQNKHVYMLVWGVFLVFFFLAGNLTESYVGRSYRTTRHDPLIAAASSINTYRVKIQSFVLGAVYCSVAGSLYAHYMVFVSPGTAGFINSADLLTMVILGGQGSLFGAVVGTGIVKMLPEMLATWNQYQLVFKGILLLMLLLFFPRGVMGGLRHLHQWLRSHSPSGNSHRDAGETEPGGLG